MFYMTQKVGAWQVDGDATAGNVGFKVFYPSGFDPEVASIRVAGSFQHLLPGGVDWDFENGPRLISDDSDAAGTFWSYSTPTPLPVGFYEYKYFVEFHDGTRRIVSDPCTRYGGISNQNAAFVIGGSRPGDNVVRKLKNDRKPLHDLVIYELHIDDFTDEYRNLRAPLDAVTDKLNYLADQGFNAILFMPWTAWKNLDFDWGYEPFQYFAVEYRYANDLNRPEEKISWLKWLISACHDRDIHVIMDGVYNHVSPDFPYKGLYQDPGKCPFAGDFGGTFAGLQDLNFHNKCTQEFIRDVCLYWIETFHIDGIRFDNTVNFYLPDLRTEGLTQLLEDIQAYLDDQQEENFSLTLEHLRIDAAELINSSKATSYWDNALYQCCFNGLASGQIESRLLGGLNNQRYLQGPVKVPTSYLSNHDHAHVTWQTGIRESVGAFQWYKSQPYAIALYTSSATPMVQNGQEFGEQYWIPEDDHGSGRRVVPRPLRWKFAHDFIGASLLKLYARLGQLRGLYRVLRTGAFEPNDWQEWQTQFNPEGLGVDLAKQVMIYRRTGEDEGGQPQCFVIVLNFSTVEQAVTVPFPSDGIWVDLLSDFNGSWQPSIQNGYLDLVVGANWGHIFFKALDSA